ncbi:DUF6999 family protein [Aquisalinus flavus]|uniref:Uncharacterized protein n=1 Tax=Aquisalinus flavus TaxID=1526572 RepID=A0A8J2Y5S3_9PROT|nr:hypothetical protein [Aquisalinus flavus]MBD0427455.1 hypothetical protein [Aquisalinus flavus]UNE47256.1 hypothetical protein FF099_03870 [Aquisalinus flavus]GGD01162.1 hypothetical protein GCM10011342_07680 [Aquisalinus flavus]
MTARPFDPASFDPKDPDPWLALHLDDSLPFDDKAKAALLEGNRSYARRFLLPASRPFIFVFFVLVKIFRRVFRTWPHAPKTLHKLIFWGLKTFARPEANLLILRHFNIGTEILAFIKANVPGVEITSHPLRPMTLEDLKDNTFLQHDLNIYNFIIELNRGLRAQGREIETPERIDFSPISDGDFDLEAFPDKWHNFVDVQTAVEFYTPVYALFLSDHDFVRAANSLQLDETIGIYLARILGSDYHMSLINNHHPMVPLSTFQAGFRLMMHGYDAEALHGHLRQMKRRQAVEDAMAGGCQDGDPARQPAQVP